MTSRFLVATFTTLITSCTQQLELLDPTPLAVVTEVLADHEYFCSAGQNAARHPPAYGYCAFEHNGKPMYLAVIDRTDSVDVMLAREERVLIDVLESESDVYLLTAYFQIQCSSTSLCYQQLADELPSAMAALDEF